MKTKSCKKCSPQGKRCDCPTESERTEQGPSDETTCYPSSTPIMDAAAGWYDRRDLLAQIGILERERDEARKKHDNLAAEHMLSVNKLCNERDEAQGLADRRAALLQQDRDGYGIVSFLRTLNLWKP